MNIKKILFLCTGNSCRSQMAEGLANIYGKNKVLAFSAGINPTYVNKYAIITMAEIGIDISKQKSKNVKEYTGQKFDYIITLCESARQECPYFPGNSIRLHWDLDDPAQFKGTEQEILSGFRMIRDKIKDNVIQLIESISIN
ncbi:MAG: arsenate reductase ArsC [Elusimicrobia bacterium]|nr:arsenate reductase ArsC [Elusimicrobiota bacterium]